MAQRREIRRPWAACPTPRSAPAHAPSRWVRCRRRILFSRAGGLCRGRLDAVRREPLDGLHRLPCHGPGAGITSMSLSVRLIARTCLPMPAWSIPYLPASAAEGSLAQLVQGHAPHMPSAQPAQPAPLRRPVLVDIVGREREPPGGEMPPCPPDQAAVRHDPPSCGGAGRGGREACIRRRSRRIPIRTRRTRRGRAVGGCTAPPLTRASREPEQLHRRPPILLSLPRWMA